MTMKTAETQSFNADVAKVLHLMIHSIYQHKEIFLRELISNASDACDKLRYKSLTDEKLLEGNPELEIKVRYDAEAKTVTVTDTGIGMTKAEMVKNLGTIASSGTQNFAEKMTGDAKKDAQLIGQFGVGFYASFMIADKVEVTSRAAGKKAVNKWISKGDGEFTVEEVKEDHPRGTSVTLHVKDGEEEYLDFFRLRHIIQTYSSHIAFPIVLPNNEGVEEKVNKDEALWLKPKSEILDEDYTAFYQQVSHLGMDEPWLTMHNKLEGALEYTSLLYVPTQKPFDLFHPERRRSVKLYVKRVFIADEGIDLVPVYLRFLRGVVDSEDLPLNISRETLQHNITLQKIKKSITKRVLTELRKKCENEREAYETFWADFGGVIKEGLCDQLEPQEDILDLCLFHSLKEDKLITIQEYVDAMAEGQEAIYFLTGDDLEALKQSPQVEGFKARGIDVILLADAVDDFWAQVVTDFKGNNLKSVTRVDAEKFDGDEAKDSAEEKEDEKDKNDPVKRLAAHMEEVLEGQVLEVRTTKKLTESPVCLAVSEQGMDMRMERFLVENQQLAAKSQKIFEINPEHAIIKGLASRLEADPTTDIDDAIHLLFAQANIVEGEGVSDVAGFSKRLNELLSKQLAA